MVGRNSGVEHLHLRSLVRMPLVMELHVMFPGQSMKMFDAWNGT